MVGAMPAGARLTYAHLENADLSQADLAGANLAHAPMNGARLRGANLEGADLSGADLSGADFAGAYIKDAVFSNTNITYKAAILAGALDTGRTSAPARICSPIGKGCEQCGTTGYYCQYRASGEPTGREQCVIEGTRFPGPCNTTWNWVGPCARL